MNINQSRCFAALDRILVIGALLAMVVSLGGCSPTDTPLDQLDELNHFDQNGRVTTRIGPSSTARAVVIQPDGKIVAAGNAFNGQHYDFFAARYHPDGSLDPSFGSEGIIVTPFTVDVWVNSAALDSDGRIIVAGERRLSPEPGVVLARYNTDGSLDTLFGTEGRVVTPNSGGNSMVLQEDGKIVVVGDLDENINLLRYNEDGSLDTSFGVDGVAKIAKGQEHGPAKDVAIQPDGKILVLGEVGDVIYGFDPVLVRVLADGSLDTTFGERGMMVTPRNERDFVPGNYDMVLKDGTKVQMVMKRGESLELQPDGKIVVAGWRASGGAVDLLLLRYNPDGALDPGFGVEGTVFADIDGGIDHGYALALLPDGRIVVAGDSSSGSVGSGHMILASFRPDGSLDHTFDEDGKALISPDERGGDTAWAVASEPDGTIIASGDNTRQVLGGGIESRIVLVRYPAKVEN